MNLYAIEIGITGADGAATYRIVLAAAADPMEASRVAMDVVRAEHVSSVWTTGHQWLLATEETPSL